MWFKEDYGWLKQVQQLSSSERGVLTSLVFFAWENQGITDQDLPRISRLLREPLEFVADVWEDFKAVAEEVNGRWALANQRAVFRINSELSAKRAAAGRAGGLRSGITRLNEATPKQNEAKRSKRKQVEAREEEIREIPEERHVPAELTPHSVVEQVFAHWKVALNHPTAKLTLKRERLIKARVKEGYTELDLKRAIDGCAASPFHRGMNDRATPYDDIELICRDGAKVEQFIAMAQQPERIANGQSGANRNAGFNILTRVQEAIHANAGGQGGSAFGADSDGLPSDAYIDTDRREHAGLPAQLLAANPRR